MSRKSTAITIMMIIITVKYHSHYDGPNRPHSPRRHMGGPEAPPAWRGGLNVTYRLGPGMAQAGWALNLEVHTYNARATTYDVVGVIRGSEEPGKKRVAGRERGLQRHPAQQGFACVSV